MSTIDYLFSFDDGSEVVYHSSLSHRDHKYIKKFWEKGKWVYEYAQDKINSARNGIKQLADNIVNAKTAPNVSDRQQSKDLPYKNDREQFHKDAIKFINYVKQKNRIDEQDRLREKSIYEKGFGVVNDERGRPRATAVWSSVDGKLSEIIWNEDAKTYTTPVSELLEHPEKYKIKDKESREAHAMFRMTDTDLARCNPDFGKPGTTSNCEKCSVAMELRLRGYDVSAGRMDYGTLFNGIELYFNNPEHAGGTILDAKRAISKYGPKTSGTISFTYPMGGGHIVHWTIDATGKFQIQDGQSGLSFDSIDEMISRYGGDRNGKYDVYRLDNCEPNFHYISTDSVLRLSDTVNTKKSKIIDRYTRKMVA